MGRRWAQGQPGGSTGSQSPLPPRSVGWDQPGGDDDDDDDDDADDDDDDDDAILVETNLVALAWTSG